VRSAPHGLRDRDGAGHGRVDRAGVRAPGRPRRRRPPGQRPGRGAAVRPRVPGASGSGGSACPVERRVQAALLGDVALEGLAGVPKVAPARSSASLTSGSSTASAHRAMFAAAALQCWSSLTASASDASSTSQNPISAGAAASAASSRLSSASSSLQPARPTTRTTTATSAAGRQRDRSTDERYIGGRSASCRPSSPDRSVRRHLRWGLPDVARFFE
jgi:hypothetical protein